MKRFYQKEVSQDKTPIVFRMDRRQTLDMNMEDMGDQNGMSARTVSVSSLAPNIPRVKTRGISKSVSENELNKGTFESLWNSSLKPEDLAPVSLQNLHMTPMTIKSSAAKTSSCLCHFATMIVLSICVVGFLASIAGVIYMEFFSSRNLTSLHSHTAEAQVDLSDVILSSPENHIDLMSNYRTFNFERVRKENIDDRVNSLYEKDKRSNNVPENEKTTLAESNRPNGKIKFQDDVAVIYEVNSTDHAASVLILNTSGNLGTENHDTDEKTEREALERKLPQTAPEEKFDRTLEKSSLKSLTLNEKSEEFHSGFPETKQKNNLERLNSDVKSQDALELPEKDEKSEILNLKNQFAMSPNPSTNGIFEERDSELLSAFQNVDENKPVPYDISDLSIYESMNEGIQPLQSEDVIPSTVQSIIEDHLAVSTEHDVDTMLMTVDDPEEEMQDFILNRNGETDDSFEFTSSRPNLSPAFTQSAGGRTNPKKAVDIKVSLTEAMKYLHALDVNKKLLSSRSKPTKKTSKPVVTTTKKPKQSTVSWQKVDNSMEKEKYLQKLRLMMYGQHQ